MAVLINGGFFDYLWRRRVAHVNIGVIVTVDKQGPRKFRLFNETRAIARESAGTRPTCPTRSICRAHKPQDDESEDDDDGSVLDAFA